MLKRVNFHPLQEVPSDELDAIQEYAQDALDTIIGDLLVRSTYYKGLAVTKSGPTEVQISSGRYYRLGKPYETAALTTNLVSYLPAGANRKIVAVVAKGEVVDTDTAPRQFIVDVDTGATRTRLVSTRIERQVVVTLVEGTESLSPVPPLVGIDYALLAYVTLSSTGIVGDPEQVTDQQVPNLEDVVTDLTLTNARLARAFSLIDTLRNDVAGLARQMKAKADRKDLLAAVERIRDLEGDVRRLDVAMRDVREAAGVPDRNSIYGLDSFATADESDTAHPAYQCEVEGGAVRLPDPSVTSALIQLLNPLDAKLKIAANGLVLPDYSEETRVSIAVKEQEIAIATYPVVAHTLTKRYPGWKFKWWKTKWGGLVEKTLKHTEGWVELIDPETGTKVNVNLYRYTWKKAGDFGPGLWIYIEDFQPYWLDKVTTLNVTGSTVAQTFLNAQAGWCIGASLLFKEIGPSGDVRIIVSECLEDGTPNPNATLETVLIPYADLKVGWVKTGIDPVHLSRGERYAILVKTNGAHRLWGSNTNDLVNGTLFYSTDGDYWDGQLNRDMSFQLHFAKFQQTRVEVNLQPVSRSGGISELDFTLTGVRPASVDFDIQAQIGGVWRNIDNTNATLFAAEPSLVPLRAVWSNTQHDAVGFVIGKSRVVVSKPDNTGCHVSTARTLPEGETSKRIVVRLILSRDYSAAHHTLASKLLYDTGFAATKTATSTTIVKRADGTHLLTAVFDFATGIDAFKIRSEFATDSAAYPIALLERSDNAESGVA